MALLGPTQEDLMRQYQEAAMQQQQRLLSNALGGLGSALSGCAGLANAYPEKKKSTIEIPPMKPKSYREELQAEIDEWLR